MDALVGKQVFTRNLRILFWITVVLSSISCLFRADWNIIISFFGLVIITKYYEKSQNYFLGLLFYSFAGSIVLDVFWMMMILPAWNSNAIANKKWDELSGLHGLVTLTSLLEILAKAIILGLIVKRPNSNGKLIPDLRYYNNGSSS